MNRRVDDPRFVDLAFAITQAIDAAREEGHVDVAAALLRVLHDLSNVTDGGGAGIH